MAVVHVLRAWALVWCGNLAGALGIALLAVLAGHHMFGGGQVGLTALHIADTKAALPFDRAVVLGILCNTLVYLAVWLSLSSRQPAHRAILTVLPIAAFVAGGLEHAVANMYFIGFGLMVKDVSADDFWTLTSSSASTFPDLNLPGFAAYLIGVTIGIVIGARYWWLVRCVLVAVPPSNNGKRLALHFVMFNRSFVFNFNSMSGYEQCRMCDVKPHGDRLGTREGIRR